MTTLIIVSLGILIAIAVWIVCSGWMLYSGSEKLKGRTIVLTKIQICDILIQVPKEEIDETDQTNGW